MISAAVNSLSPDFSGLTAEISKSVSHIRLKRPLCISTRPKRPEPKT